MRRPAGPFLALPRLPGRDLPRLATDYRAMPAEPRRGASSLTYPRHACPARTGLGMPMQSKPASQAKPRRSVTIAALPSLPCRDSSCVDQRRRRLPSLPCLSYRGHACRAWTLHARTRPDTPFRACLAFACRAWITPCQDPPFRACPAEPCLPASRPATRCLPRRALSWLDGPILTAPAFPCRAFPRSSLSSSRLQQGGRYQTKPAGRPASRAASRMRAIARAMASWPSAARSI